MWMSPGSPVKNSKNGFVSQKLGLQPERSLERATSLIKGKLSRSLKRGNLGARVLEPFVFSSRGKRPHVVPKVAGKEVRRPHTDRHEQYGPVFVRQLHP